MASSSLSRPSVENIANASEYTIIQLIKCGSVVSVCVILRKPELLISLSIIANTIGSGSRQKLITANMIVLVMTRRMSRELNISSKYLPPTNSFASSGVPGLYSKNDSDQPSSGRYENMNAGIISGSDMKNKIPPLTGLFTHGLCRGCHKQSRLPYARFMLLARFYNGRGAKPPGRYDFFAYLCQIRDDRRDAPGIRPAAPRRWD